MIFIHANYTCKPNFYDITYIDICTEASSDNFQSYIKDGYEEDDKATDDIRMDFSTIHDTMNTIINNYDVSRIVSLDDTFAFAWQWCCRKYGLSHTFEQAKFVTIEELYKTRRSNLKFSLDMLLMAFGESNKSDMSAKTIKSLYYNLMDLRKSENNALFTEYLDVLKDVNFVKTSLINYTDAKIKFFADCLCGSTDISFKDFKDRVILEEE